MSVWKNPLPSPSNRITSNRNQLGAHRSGEGPEDMSSVETSIIKTLTATVGKRATKSSRRNPDRSSSSWCWTEAWLQDHHAGNHGSALRFHWNPSLLMLASRSASSCQVRKFQAAQNSTADSSCRSPPVAPNHGDPTCLTLSNGPKSDLMIFHKNTPNS